MNVRDFFERHGWLKQVLWTLLASLGICIVILFLIKIYARQGREYVLPDVVGFTTEQVAEDNPLNLRFVVLDSVYRPGEAGGIIIVQSPKAGTKVKKARKIYLTVTSVSPEDVAMPDVQDLTLRQAVNMLERSGLQVGRLDFVQSPYNVVLAASAEGVRVEKGDMLPMGSRVNLQVGMGDKEITSIVPFVIGKTGSKARADIYRASLNVGREHYGGVSDKATAVVVKMEPDYTGVSRYPNGTSVDLWYQDANTVDAAALRKNFKVDSSKILRPQQGMEDEEQGAAETW